MAAAVLAAAILILIHMALAAVVAARAGVGQLQRHLAAAEAAPASGF